MPVRWLSLHECLRSALRCKGCWRPSRVPGGWNPRSRRSALLCADRGPRRREYPRGRALELGTPSLPAAAPPQALQARTVSAAICLKLHPRQALAALAALHYRPGFRAWRRPRCAARTPTPQAGLRGEARRGFRTRVALLEPTDRRDDTRPGGCTALILRPAPPGACALHPTPPDAGLGAPRLHAPSSSGSVVALSAHASLSDSLIGPCRF